MGAPGRGALERRLQAIKSEHEIDACVVNGENAADGMGLSAKLAHKLLAAGADVVLDSLLDFPDWFAAWRGD